MKGDDWSGYDHEVQMQHDHSYRVQHEAPEVSEPMTEEEWNSAHGLTAKCPQCGGAMKDDGRRFCSWACWHKAPEEDR